MGLRVKGIRFLVGRPLKTWLCVPQKVMPRNPDKLAYAKSTVSARDLHHGTCRAKTMSKEILKMPQHCYPVSHNRFG